MLLISATNFNQTFFNIVYLGIKMMLDKAKVKYSSFYIVQASYLKEILEELELKRDEVTIASVDAINMYPSIKLSTIKKSERLFARKITAATKKIINICLELIRFGMSYTLTSFDGEYYKYHSRENEEQNLVVGGYELSFLSDLVASYLFDKAKALLNPKFYHGVYQDYSLVVFKRKKSVKEIKDWLEKFHQTVNRAAYKQHLQFTA